MTCTMAVASPDVTTRSVSVDFALHWRQRYLQKIGEISGLGIAAVNNYRSRLARSSQRVTLGELVPPLFLELTRIDDGTRQLLALAWAFLYHHSLIVDDLQDGVLQAHEDRIIAARLFRNARLQFQNLTAGDDQLRRLFTRVYRQQLAAGAQAVGAPAALSQRGATVKYFVALTIWLSGGERMTPSQEQAVGALLAGFQALDDATDVKEDEALRAAREETHGDAVRPMQVVEAARFAAGCLSAGLHGLAVPESAELHRFVSGYIDHLRRTIRDAKAGRTKSLPLASN